MQLTVLGCHSATPREKTRPTSQVLEIRGRLILVDCGEGTQMALRKNSIKFSRIKHIFISHLHGDHFYGLIGLISTFCLTGREKPLTVYGPQGIKEIIELQLKYAKAYTTFDLRFQEIVGDDPVRLYDDDKITVSTIPLNHRVYTNGYLFTEKLRERTLDIEACQEYKIDRSDFNRIKKGEDVHDPNGKLIRNDLLSTDPDPPKSYAFCSDTAYKPDIVPLIKGATALYHESTFLKEHKDLCDKTKHSTAAQAGKIAAKAQVKNLILGHYSARYPNKDLFKQEAQYEFQTVHLAKDGRVFNF